MFAVVNAVKLWQNFLKEFNPQNRLLLIEKKTNLINHVLISRQETRVCVSKRDFSIYQLFFFTKGLRPEHQQVKYSG